MSLMTMVIHDLRRGFFDRGYRKPSCGFRPLTNLMRSKRKSLERRLKYDKFDNKNSFDRRLFDL